MMHAFRITLVGALVAAALSAPAQAQYYGATPRGAPLYPYAAQPSRPYAVEVAPGTYLIQRPLGEGRSRAERTSRRARSHNNPAMVEELRRRHAGRRAAKTERRITRTRKIVHDKPVVIEHTRVVDDPPKVIVRKHYVEDTRVASPPRDKKAAVVHEEGLLKADGKKRVIQAEAEITILGPDRMSIRLFRKRHAGEAKASAE